MGEPREDIGRQINICNYTTQSLSEKRSGNICLSFQEARITDTRNKTKTAHTQKRKLQTSVLYKYSCKILHKITVNRIQQYVTKNLYTYTNTLYEQVKVTAGMQRLFNT